MATSLNGAGRAFASSCISSGKVDKSSSWSFSAEDGNKWLGPNGDDWTNYGKHFLGIHSDQPEKTKAHYGYPCFKGDTVYRSGLIAVKQRAAAQGDTEIENAADKMVDKIDGVDPNKDDDADDPKKGKVVQLPTAGYRMNAAASGASAEIFLYDVIGSGWMGGISAEQFASDLRGLGSLRTIDLRINSDGGDVFDGRTIYSLLSQHPANINVYVDGLAASIASLIAMAGDQIIMADGAMIMIHSAWGVTVGNAADMRKQADLLDMVDQTLVKTYSARTKMDPAKCKQLMAEETWMTSDECIKNGFADSIAEPMKAAACVRDLVSATDGRVVSIAERFRHAPSNLLPRRAAAAAEQQALRQFIAGHRITA